MYQRTAFLSSLLALGLAGGCSGSDSSIRFGEPGPIAGEAGRGSFTFGAATAAAQIEEDNEHADWWVWSKPVAEGGLGKGLAFAGDAVRGYDKAVDDVALLEEMNLDAYRFSVNWARMEPTRDNFDEAAFAHYDELVDALVAADIKPTVTLHHFSSPVWVDDPLRLIDHDNDPTTDPVLGFCKEAPSDTDLCGWSHPEGSKLIIEEMREFGAAVAKRYGDRVDEWFTVNEPINYLLAAYGMAVFPPGRMMILDIDKLVLVFENYVAAHIAMYDAIKENDTIDADGDGVAAAVGYTLNVAEWEAAQKNMLSDAPADVAAAEGVRYIYHYLFTDAIMNGGFDRDLDGVADVDYPEWKGKLDFLGVQYYARMSVTGTKGIVPGVLPDIRITPCFPPFDFGSCIPAEEPTHYVPTMRYTYYEPGIYNVLTDFAARYPDLPMTVTESGLATESGTRRAEHIVRSLEQISLARDEGVDVRGYYHWSLTDNFEWAEGFHPRFGLYRVDYDSPDYTRTATEGATVLGEIAGARRITAAQRTTYGGLGPMTPEPEAAE